MHYHNIHKTWLEYAVMHACDVLNMLPTSAINDKTPNFAWSEKVPDLSKLRIWGCLAFAHRNSRKLPKLEPRAVPCMYIGHSSDGDGWKLINWLTGKIITCQSVQFFEDCSGFKCPEARVWLKDIDPNLF